ncbi:hypothetical protein AZI87_16025 [Bdellovibrio bacteriovorus]|uniref:Uncharacterized protein n=1 Tax=Bdellovibrio bacteriovorus TaxID=959 RepID=A0A162FYI3_BDEBC|nr:hypothetical protein [Bdellovibrio bacteriovorus]KYG62782.1 hypothetical protein AZI87_16025 [Bdellovibrio bacteriovorus]
MHTVIAALFSSLLSFAQSPFQIEVRKIEPSKKAEPYLEFSFDGKECHLKKAGLPKKISPSDCKKTTQNLLKYLKEPKSIGDYLHPHRRYYQVKVEGAEGTWSRIILREKTRVCTASGHCTEPIKTTPTLIAEELLKI